MLRLLMQAGLSFATFDVGRRIGRLKRLAIAYAIAGVVSLLGLGALVAALIILLEPRLGAAGAAGAVGGGLLVLAALVGWIGGWNPRPKRPATIVDRVRAEVGAAGSALSEARSSRPRRAAKARSAVADDVLVDDGIASPAVRGSRGKRALNIVLIGALAGIVLGRRL